MSRLLVVASTMFVASSGSCPPRPVPTPPQDAGDVPFQGGPCEAAQANMSKLGCVPNAPGDAGTWLDVCKNAREHAIDLHTSCRTKALGCGDVTACDKL